MEPVSQDTLSIDPVAMNVVNRIAAGSHLHGQHVFEGGVLVQGSLSGQTEIHGRLIVWAGGLVTGHVKVLGDLYLFGHLGEKTAVATATQIECLGTAFIASTGVSTGHLMAQRLRLYEGADLQGPFRTLAAHASLPRLRRKPSDADPVTGPS